MSVIVLNTNKMPLSGKLDLGVQVINMSTGNPNVPGNAVPLTAFSNAQADLIAAKAAYEQNRQDGRELMAARDAALVTWTAALACLAGFTENATLGDKTKILSAGFLVRSEPTPTQPLGAPINVLVETNGSPGVSKVSWLLDGADTFIVQCSATPEDEKTWVQVLVTTRSSAEIPGAEPGKPCWFRVAGVNALGQGPWSATAPRPVM
jgi:hypothetical protein